MKLRCSQPSTSSCSSRGQCSCGKRRELGASVDLRSYVKEREMAMIQRSNWLVIIVFFSPQMIFCQTIAPMFLTTLNKIYLTEAECVGPFYVQASNHKTWTVHITPTLVATVMMAIIGIMISRIIFPIPISSFH
jgi:hypothetical protein